MFRESGQDTSGFYGIYTNVHKWLNATWKKEIFHNSFKGPFKDYRDSNTFFNIKLLHSWYHLKVLLVNVWFYSTTFSCEETSLLPLRNLWFLTTENQNIDSITAAFRGKLSTNISKLYSFQRGTNIVLYGSIVSIHLYL